MEVYTTPEFEKWLMNLRDAIAQAKIASLLDRLENAPTIIGDWKTVGNGIGELRVDHGPGYRLYFARKGNRVVVLLIGGDKRRQQADIKNACRILDELKNQGEW
ncbi:type II toxin-antitoxin system RelE/ParE family toxin [Bifidobacterium pseudolongum]|uniref:Type II toxin-antitoxin system RelE/ParE family toxin n=1 Tax=Bifidobacterium pseudolongum TaxID=1694 RepID=A0A4S4FCL7_9BIFI|nr:type II toxin-antitoxin system RelE/ParE family toxin [Bifidobacterium pseudolongum]THG27312.1 type II toxin-antitoxin system RelE/ParE family toxin [Bifidobacterium pseudolongum]